MRLFLKNVFVFLFCGVTPVWAAPPTAALDVSAIHGTVAPAPWNAIIGPAPLTVNFDASGSSDDGTIELYVLNHGIGATNGVPYYPDELLQEGFVPGMSYTYTMPGTYNNVTVRVQDNDGEWSNDSFPTWSIVVTESLEPSCPGNTPPTAALDVSPIIGETPLTVEFDGSGSSDDGTIELYKFYHGHGHGTGESGPYTIVLDEPFQEKLIPKASYIYTTPGYYTNVHLKVKDNDGCWSEPASAAVALSEAITIKVKVPNVAPTAVLEADPEQGEAPLKVVFDASGSSDDGTIQKYIYFFGNADGEVFTESSYTYIYDTPGTYDAHLRVQDNDGAWSDYSLPVPITVTGPNVPPTAVLDIYLGPPTSDQSTPLTVEFDASGSNDVDGDVAVYAFNFDDGSPLEVIDESDTVHVYTTPGIYHARLRVQDNDGAWSNWSNPMSFSATGNFPPTAVLSATPEHGEAHLTVYFHAGGSFDVDGTIEKYIFDFGDGEEGAVEDQPASSHIYKKPGTYTATLVVRDNDQAPSASDPFPVLATKTITVARPELAGQAEKKAAEKKAAEEEAMKAASKKAAEKKAAEEEAMKAASKKAAEKKAAEKKAAEEEAMKAASKKAAEKKAAEEEAMKAASKKAAEKKAAEKKAAEEEAMKAAKEKAKKAEEKQKAEEQRQEQLKRKAEEREKKATEEKARKNEADQRAWKNKIAANYTRARHEEMKTLARRYGILSWFESKYPDPKQD
jgi:PKD repeat protein